MAREVKLPSGAVLTINPSSFADARALYQAFLAEMKAIKLDLENLEMVDLYKELFCVGFSSPKIEACLWECFKRCTYDRGGAPMKIDGNTFDEVAARRDYMQVCIEVAKENIDPFVSGLSASLRSAGQMIDTFRA